MEYGPEVGEIYSAYEAVVLEYNDKVEHMLAVARDPESSPEVFRAASAEVTMVAERLDSLRKLIRARFGSSEPWMAVPNQS